MKSSQVRFLVLDEVDRMMELGPGLGLGTRSGLHIPNEKASWTTSDVSQRAMIVYVNV